MRDADAAGLTRGQIRGMLRRGEAERISRGLYRTGPSATELDTVVAVCARIPEGIVCLLTALTIHEIGTQLPPEVWIAIDRKARKPRIADMPVRIVRFSGAMLTYGIEHRKIQGIDVNVTSLARTVVDCFRYRNKIGIDVALEALKDAIRRRQVGVDAIVRAALVGRVDNVMRPYLEAVLA
jgi:predicted transcriptional regulator of viral defense system